MVKQSYEKDIDRVRKELKACADAVDKLEAALTAAEAAAK